MADSTHVAESFFDAWTGGDFAGARALLSDNVSFAGPLDAFDNADSYMASLERLGGMVTGVERQRLFLDGDEACVIYDLHTAPVPTTRVCEWYQVRDGKIASASVVFDARPFAALFDGHGGQ